VRSRRNSHSALALHEGASPSMRRSSSAEEVHALRPDARPMPSVAKAASVEVPTSRRRDHASRPPSRSRSGSRVGHAASELAPMARIDSQRDQDGDEVLDV
jgi:hypothetical protein